MAYRTDDSIEKDSGTGTDRNSLASEDFSDLEILETVTPKKSKKRKLSYEEERKPKKQKLLYEEERTPKKRKLA